MRRIKVYFQETWDELLYKVSWPSWQELQSSAIVVLISSLIIALIVFVMDFAFGINQPNPLQWKGLLGSIYDLFK